MEEIRIDNLNERDKVIRTLAGVKLSCYLKVLSGTCQESNCPDCFKYQTDFECLDQMSNFDKLQIDSTFEAEFRKVYKGNIRTANSVSAKPKSRLRGMIGSIIGSLIVFSSLWGLAFVLFGKILLLSFW